MHRILSRRLLPLLGLVVLVVVIAFDWLIVLASFQTTLTGTPVASATPPEVVEPSVGPVTTGRVASGAGHGVAADSVPFSRPEFRYIGGQPWQIHRAPSGRLVLEGYTSRPSYLPGDLLEAAVNTSAPTFDLSIWRVSGGAPVIGPFQKMATLSRLVGHVQQRPAVDPVTSMVAASWAYDVAFRIPVTWPSDVYLIRLDSSEGVQQYVPFVVVSPVRHDVLVVTSVMNWEAYNDWGGSSVYGTTVGQPLPGLSRALAVSLDRPYSHDAGAGQLFFLDLPFDAWVLRQGLDVAFTTDYDLSLDPGALPLPRVIVFNGHDEYWGPKLYRWLDQHVNRQGDLGLAMLAADSGYWPVELQADSGAGPRDMIALKDGPVPPQLGVPANRAAPGVGSASPGPSASDDTEERGSNILGSVPTSGPLVGRFPDQPLFGVSYAGITSSLGRYRMGTDVPSGVLALTGLGAGANLGFIAGGEVDGVSMDPALVGPDKGAHDHIFAEAALIPGRSTGDAWTAQAVWRDLPSGGRVFSSGTFYWGWALDPAWGDAHQVPGGFGALTGNILRWLAHA